MALIDYWEMIKRAVAVNSTAVAEVAFDEKRGVMVVKFHNGRVYEYKNVPQSLYEQVIHAQSVGKFINEVIVKNPTAYPFKELI